ncbi:MAG: 2-oxo acid dehydrogenase subunit E2 [Deferribacteres bacterium]|nr:2-oxo acid dehydrogenase subunit E2 [candidate division KSB1 bacterium]MCB9500905.1 2-oxo acid dehydrogenase subunit E2 [Deferribacteres bacterium]
MAFEFKLPELGENIESGTIASVKVKEGETISENQVVLELETDKAVVDIPAPADGVITKLFVNEGDEIKIGQIILVLKEGGVAVAPEATKPAEPQPAVEESPKQTETELEPLPVSQVVEPVPEERATPQPELVEPAAALKPAPISRSLVPAAPSVRRFAREIGIDVNAVPGTGPGGRISIEDVKAYSKQLNQQQVAPGRAFAPHQEALPDFSKWGEIDRQAMSKIRKTTATHLSYAWSTIPHVTQFDKADLTHLEKLRKQFAPRIEAAGGKLTFTVILLKIIEAALKKYPQFNSSIDMQSFEVIYKKFYNIGIAVDTEHGLLVPVVKNVDKKNLTQLSVEVNDIARKARERKLSLDDMQGGNFSISNLGGIGGTGFTPIVNSPEVAILGVSRSSIEPVWIDGKFEPRMILPLSLSYDHRIIDGADAARFLRFVCEVVEEPFLMSMEG